MGRYWFSLKYLAMKDGNGRYERLANHFAPRHASLSALLEYPELTERGPAPEEPPQNYERLFPAIRVARIRRSAMSATLLLGENSRFLTFRHGDCVVNGVRFASAFFGKAQFVPSHGARRGNVYVFEQELEGPYYQPFDPPRTVAPEEWGETRGQRRRSEVCRLRQAAEVRERRNGFAVEIRAEGTVGVPVAVEVNFREGGVLEGCEPAHKVEQGWILKGERGLYRAAKDTMRFGPGRAEHSYTQIRGAEPKMPGPSVYLTGYTPFAHTLLFEW
jgi:hypothetical protein